MCSQALLKNNLRIKEFQASKMNSNNITPRSKTEAANLKEHQAEETNLLKRKRDEDDCKSDVKYIKVDLPVKASNTQSDVAEYYFENGLRKVYPYYFTYSTHCKGRWVGKRLLDVFSSEFRAVPREEYEESILSGDVLVNGEKIAPDFVLKDNDLITNKVHRHEVGVIGAPVKIIHLSDDLVVVDKPPSIPVHPCGRYRYNTLLFLLAREHNLKDLHTIHRLDRLTSGIVLFSRTLKKSQELDKQVRSHEVFKEYLCRVEGLFPDGLLTCDQPVEVLSPKVGICIVSSTGKECFTEFERLSYNGKSSVVRCKPKTGRMHQIRVHLQYLGFPIVNDPVYNSFAFGPLKGKGGETGKTKEQLLNDLMEVHNLEKWLETKDSEPSSEKSSSSMSNKTILKVLKHNLNMTEYEQLENKYKKDMTKFTTDPNCRFCHKTYKDPEPKDLIIFLHAFRYKGDSWDFQTELPLWASSDYEDM